MARRQATDGVELIEILDPADLDAPWEPAASSTGPDRAPPPAAPDRRATIGLVVLVALAAGAWGAVTWLGGDDAPPAPPQRRFVLEADGLTPYSADLVDDDVSGAAFTLWSDGDATLEVVARRGATAPLVAADAWAEDVGGVTAVHTTDPDGAAVVTVERALPDGWSAVVRGRSLTARDVVAAADVVRVQERTDGTVVDLADRSFVSRLREVLRGADLDQALHGAVDSVVRYTDDRGDEYTLRVAEAEGELGWRQAREALEVVGADRVAEGGRVAARLPAEGSAMAVWSQGTALVSLSGPASPARLLALSQDVRAATDDEWLRLLRGLQPDLRLGDTSVIDVGEDDAGRWIAGVQRVQRLGEVSLQWWFSEPADRTTVRSAPATMPAGGAAPREGEVLIDTFVVDGVTYVFVQASAEMADRGVTVAQFGDGPPPFAPVRLAPAFLDDDTVMGVVRFAGPGTVRLVSGS